MFLHQTGHRFAVFTIGELQVLDISPNDRRRLLVRHIEQLLLVVIIEGPLVGVLLQRTLTHNQGLDSPCRRRCRSIGMDRNEQVAARLVGDIGPSLQILGQTFGKLLVRLTRVNHFQLGDLLLDQGPELQSDLKVEIFLINASVMSSRKLRPPVPGIDYDDPHALCNILRGNSVERECRNQKQGNKKKRFPHSKSG